MAGEDWIVLVCPPGSTDAPISHGTIAYSPYREIEHDPTSRWLVRVPRHVAAPLLDKGGFYEVKN